MVNNEEEEKGRCWKKAATRQAMPCANLSSDSVSKKKSAWSVLPFGNYKVLQLQSEQLLYLVAEPCTSVKWRYALEIEAHTRLLRRLTHDTPERER